MINLLPPRHKKEILLEESRRLTIALIFVALLSLFCLIIILGFLKIYLLTQIDFQRSILKSAEKNINNPEAQIIIEKIKNSNEKLSKVNNFYEQKHDLEEVLEKLSQTIPENIYLTNLSYSKNSSQIILAGFSPSKDLLAQFRKNLKEKEGFYKIYFPVSSWNEFLNINFSGVTINLKDENSN